MLGKNVHGCQKSRSEQVVLKQKIKNDHQPKFTFCVHTFFVRTLSGWCVCVCLGAVVPQLDQCQGAVLLWSRCTAGCGVFSTSTEAFLQTLNNTYKDRIPDRGARLSDTGGGSVASSSVRNKTPGECRFPNENSFAVTH